MTSDRETACPRAPGEEAARPTEVTRKDAGGDVDEPYRPCTRCCGLAGVHYLTCPLLRRAPHGPEPAP